MRVEDKSTGSNSLFILKCSAAVASDDEIALSVSMETEGCPTYKPHSSISSACSIMSSSAEVILRSGKPLIAHRVSVNNDMLACELKIASASVFSRFIEDNKADVVGIAFCTCLGDGCFRSRFGLAVLLVPILFNVLFKAPTAVVGFNCCDIDIGIEVIILLARVTSVLMFADNVDTAIVGKGWSSLIDTSGGGCGAGAAGTVGVCSDFFLRLDA